MWSLEHDTAGSDCSIQAVEVILMSDFKPITSQADLDSAIADRLKRERKSERAKIIRAVRKHLYNVTRELVELSDELHNME